MSKEIKFAAACGAGENASHQIKDAVEAAMAKRGFAVTIDAFKTSEITPDLLSNYAGYLTVANTKLNFAPKVPVVDAGAVLYGFDAMTEPVIDQIEKLYKATK